MLWHNLKIAAYIPCDISSDLMANRGHIIQLYVGWACFLYFLCRRLFVCVKQCTNIQLECRRVWKGKAVNAGSRRDQNDNIWRRLEDVDRKDGDVAKDGTQLIVRQVEIQRDLDQFKDVVIKTPWETFNNHTMLQFSRLSEQSWSVLRAVCINIYVSFLLPQQLKVTSTKTWCLTVLTWTNNNVRQLGCYQRHH